MYAVIDYQFARQHVISSGNVTPVLDTSIERKLEGSGGIVELEDNEGEREGEREKRKREKGKERGREKKMFKINVRNWIECVNVRRWCTGKMPEPRPL